MASLTVCILTHNSLRTIASCLMPALQVADEMIVVDSGSSDGTLEFLAAQGIDTIAHPYETHARQMNFAIAASSNDWVLCLDSDEFMDADCVAGILQLKYALQDTSVGYRIQRHWYVLNQEVHAIYPVSSPDRPIRLFNRKNAAFNDEPVDDKVVGYSSKQVLKGQVKHDTFFSVDEIFSKLNSYTARLIRNKEIAPSLLKAFFSPPVAFLKWYFRKGAYRDGSVGVITAVYAALYSFLKYFRAWCRSRGLP